MSVGRAESEIAALQTSSFEQWEEYRMEDEDLGSGSGSAA